MKNLKGGSVSIDMKANVNDQKEDVMQIHPYAADYLHKARTLPRAMLIAAVTFSRSL